LQDNTRSYTAVLTGHMQFTTPQVQQSIPKEITLRVTDNNTDENLRSKDTKTLLQTLRAKMGDQDIISAVSLPSGDIHIHVSTKNSLEKLHQDEPWTQAKAGVRPILPTAMVEIADVLLWAYDTAKTSPEEFLQELQDSNTIHLLGIDFKRVHWLRKLYSDRKKSLSLIISVKDNNTANHIIENRLLARNRWKKARAWDHQCEISQYFKCYAIGHIGHNCHNSQRCGKCTEEHPTKDCPNANEKCALCGGKHAAWNMRKCPIWQKAMDKAAMHKYHIQTQPRISQTNTKAPTQPSSQRSMPPPSSLPRVNENGKRTASSENPFSIITTPKRGRPTAATALSKAGKNPRQRPIEPQSRHRAQSLDILLSSQESNQESNNSETMELQ